MIAFQGISCELYFHWLRPGRYSKLAVFFKKVIILLFLVFLFLPAQACRSGQPKGKHVNKKGSLAMGPFLFIIKRHRELGTKMDGVRCPMFPSCSAYAEKALRKHSFLGILMFIDRILFRETGDLKSKYLLTPRYKSYHFRYHDPLEDTLPLFKDKHASLLTDEFE